MKNKKILIIIADITRAGGTERACINLANILRDNHKVSILSLGKNGMPFFELDKDVEVTFTNLNEIPKKLKDKFQWYGKTFKFLKHFINQSNYDVIIGEGHNISVFLPFLKNKGNSNTIQIRGSKNIIVEGSGNTILVKEDIENGIHILGKNNKLIIQSVSSIIVDGDNNIIKWKENKDNKQPRIRLIGVNNVAELNISN